jgi:hypothetical protein
MTFIGPHFSNSDGVEGFAHVVAKPSSVLSHKRLSNLFHEDQHSSIDESGARRCRRALGALSTPEQRAFAL